MDLPDIAPLDAAAMAAADARQGRLTKPPGSMGRLEALGTQLAGIAGVCPPPLPEPVAVAVFAGDHGVHAQGVTPWPQEVTVQMVANVCAGGAVVSVLAAQVGADVTVVDVGVAGDPRPHDRLVGAKVARGTADLSAGPAMS
ncbi:MAG TPA: nicotinate-nucleotide--dimethylbenzimidazole phosphoribosyltransferase, partial [Lapillicoccus sp.]|nr:nicotinate-nucleotide--dimethylbenzimidazole phosphoribosyltransferase [Lapillicoccus sp.]